MGSLARVLHPAVYGLYFACVLVITMLCLQPLCIVCSWVGAVIGWLLTRSEITLRSLGAFFGIQCFLITLMALGNFIFSSHGQTVLFTLGTRHFYVESALYGACMGCMLGAVLVWFGVLEAILSPDDVRQLGARFLPTVSLMLSMMLAYFPQLFSRGKRVAALTDANTAAFAHHTPHPQTSCSLKHFWRRRVQALRQTSLLRTLSVLLGWSLEDSLIQAKSLQARGYGSGKRSCFLPRHWHAPDVLALALVLAGGVLAALAGYKLTESFSFYPAWTSFSQWDQYLPFVVFMFMPALYFGWLKTRSMRL